MGVSRGDTRSELSEESVLEARNLVKVYNEGDPSKEPVTAIDQANFSIADNEFVAVVGPSGCGKTTLLKVCAGLVEASDGDILYRGEPVTGPSTERAVVFQHFNLFPWRTVIENVFFGLEMEGVPEDECRERAQKYIDMVKLSGFTDNYPGELSGGMQQRVGLARALTVNPDVLLMDEPFGALDAQTREMMQNELLQIWEQDRKTILFITHDIDEALLLADRILVMGTSPRRFIGEMDVPFERPRYDRDIESHPEYSEMKQDIWDMLEHNLEVE